jgi:hypothetical protein
MAHRPYPNADRAAQITRHIDETGQVGDQSRSLSPLTLKLTAEVSAGPQVFGSSLAKMLTPARQAPPVDEYQVRRGRPPRAQAAPPADHVGLPERQPSPQDGACFTGRTPGAPSVTP